MLKAEIIPSISKILVIQTAFIGDLVLTTPLVRAIRRGFPYARISVLAIPQTADLLVGNPHIDDVILYDKRGKERGIRAFLKLGNRLRKEHFDLAIVPHRSFRSALLTALSGIRQRIGFNTSIGAFLFTHRAFYRKDVHEIERNLDLLLPFGIYLEDKNPEIFPSPQDQEWVAEFLWRNEIQASHRLVAIAPGSVWPTKCWLPERFTEVARLLFKKFGTMTVLIGGVADRQLCQQIAKALPSGVGAVAAGQMSLRQSAALLERCTLLLSNDSAPVHLAAAMKTPVVAIFGPTVPAFGFAPWGEGNTVVQKQLKCRPCGIHGGGKCPRGHFQCMKGISPEQVFREICRILQPRFGKH
ncbi:MAG: lipopolysaccharide heptosyltransferase II [Candidatus Latescibacteria bacterium]|nr:lipopolysaccharide heptosyltransferase II [Candidatus Latescibacterota bacterium]